MFRWKRYPEAAKAYEEAIRLDPKNLSAKKNLKSVGEKHAVNAMEPGKGVQCTIC